jgi:cysteine synthase A
MAQSSRRAESILDLIGATPLLQLRRLADPGMAEVWAKCEQFNPAGSVKDRIALAMIEAAERDGRIEPGRTTIVEPTSGNTGIGLALVCMVKRYKLVLTMPESMSLERRSLLTAYGARILLTPAERGMDGAVERAEELCRSDVDYFLPQQFNNPANPDVHFHRTARELIDQLGDPGCDAFVAGVGTGGTISGVGRLLKSSYPGVRVVALEPAGSPVLAGGRAGPHKIQGIGAGFIPRTLDIDVIDEIQQVTDRDAYEMKVRLAREEGLLVGISSGANAWAACQLARRLGAGKRVVTVMCDTGERYFSLDEYFA